MSRLSVLLYGILIMVLSGGLLQADNLPPQYTADYYALQAEKYMGTEVLMHVSQGRRYITAFKEGYSTFDCKTQYQGSRGGNIYVLVPVMNTLKFQNKVGYNPERVNDKKPNEGIKTRAVSGIFWKMEVTLNESSNPMDVYVLVIKDKE